MRIGVPLDVHSDAEHFLRQYLNSIDRWIGDQAGEFGDAEFGKIGAKHKVQIYTDAVCYLGGFREVGGGVVFLVAGRGSVSPFNERHSLPIAK